MAGFAGSGKKKPPVWAGGLVDFGWLLQVFARASDSSRRRQEKRKKKP